MVCSLGEVANSGTFGRKVEMRRAERPELVGARMHLAPTRSAISSAAKPVAPLTLRIPPRSWYSLRSGRYFSVSLQMSDIVLTASIGYLPAAVSPESMTQSVPS